MPSETKQPSIAGQPGAPAQGSALDEGFQPIERLIPLLGDAGEILAGVFERLGIQLEATLPPFANAADEACALEDAQMFGYRLSRELRAHGELSDGAWPPVRQPRDDEQTRL